MYGPFFLHVCPVSRSLSIAIRFTLDIPDYPWRFACFQKAHGQAADHEGGNGGPPATVSLVPPPPHVRILANFIRLLPLASYCADETERRASAAPKATEIHKTRNPRPFTGPFFGPYMHPNRPLDLKIVFNQHPKPPNGITNVFRFSAHSWVVNFLFLFR